MLNLRVEYQGYRAAVAWEDGGARYHVWLDDNGKLDGPIYKNSLCGRGNPDWFDTRKLDPTAKSNAATMRAVHDFISDGSAIEAAKAAYTERQRLEVEEANRSAAERMRTALLDEASRLDDAALRKLAFDLSSEQILALRRAAFKA
ncbi:MAG: hypothetical protein RIB97_13120 [Nitratireductor sp.]